MAGDDTVNGGLGDDDSQLFVMLNTAGAISAGRDILLGSP